MELLVPPVARLAPIVDIDGVPELLMLLLSEVGRVLTVDTPPRELLPEAPVLKELRPLPHGKRPLGIPLVADGARYLCVVLLPLPVVGLVRDFHEVPLPVGGLLLVPPLLLLRDVATAPQRTISLGIEHGLLHLRDGSVVLAIS